MAERIAEVRGSPIESYGSTDLLLRDAGGEPRRIMQADESVYLHPGQARLPGAAMVVGEDDFPDVVLEVDHTTDVHRGKLALYESWGFPEVWVEVPDTPSPSRPHRRRPGLTIHVLEHGRFRVAAESRAFPGWRAEEIHLALNEPVPSAQTSAVVERVAAALGARAKAPARTTTCCCARNGARGSSMVGRGWSVRHCCHGASRCRRGSRPAPTHSPPHPRRCCWRRRSAARIEAEFLAALRRPRDPGG